MRRSLSNCFTAAAVTFALLAAQFPAMAASAVQIDWADLIPRNPFDALLGNRPEIPHGYILHGQLTAPPPGGSNVVTRYNGKAVTLSGYVIPLEYTAKGATQFMLVPFVGACIHVPPPPPNQLVLVTTGKPVPMDNLFAPFTVTGVLDTTKTRTDLAEVGYTLKATAVKPYK